MMKKTQPVLQRHALAIAVCLALGGGIAQAQSSNATLRGAVTGPQATVANAEVVATNVDTGFTLRTRAASDGNYVIAGLPPGSYKVVVTGADGKKNESNVTLQVSQTASLDLAIGGTEAANSQELTRVVVSGAAVVDRKTSEVGTYVTPQQMQRLPQVTRNFLSFADMAPGVNVTYDGEGNAKIRSGATTRDSLNVFIDGAGQKDYVMRGGVSGQESSRGNPFPQSALAEYKVITQNYKAEFDQVSSAAITAVTKSGTNEFHGEVFYDHTGSNWRAKTEGEKLSGNKVKSKQDQYGVSLGGPIIQDHMHYFVAYEGKKNRDPRSVTGGGPAGATSLLPPEAQALLGSVAAPFDQDLLFAKIDWSPVEAHRFDLSVKFRQEEDLKNVQKEQPLEFGSNNTIDETRFDLRWQFFGERITNEARVTYEDVAFSQEAVNRRPSANYNFLEPADTDDGDLVLSTGGNNYYNHKAQKGYSIQNDTTISGLDAAGSHVVKIGAKVKWITVDAIEQYHQLPQFWYNIAPGGSLTQPYRAEFGAALPGVGDGSVQAKNTQFGIYAQDDWEVNKKLTLNIGARYDIESSPVYKNHVTPADIVAALNSPDSHTYPGYTPNSQSYFQTLTNGGVNINDYISTGSERKTFKKGFQPRLGFSYDLFGDKQHVVFGGYGRSYDRNIFDVMQLERTKGTFPNYRVDFCHSGPPILSGTCIPWDPNFLNPGALSATPLVGGREVTLLNNNLKTPYSDQFALGIRDAVGIWNTEVSLSHVETKDIFTWLLGNRRPDGAFWAPGTNGGSPWDFGVPGFSALILGNSGLSTTVTSLFLKADKPYSKESGWSATIAYTFSDTEENHNLKDDLSYSLDYPTIAQIPMLRSVVVPRHKLILAGSYDAPYGILASGRVNFASPLGIRGTMIGCGSDNTTCAEQVVDKNSFRSIDVSLAKSFNMPGGFKLTLRGDVINIFNYKNYEDYNVAWGIGGVGTTRTVTPGSNLAGPPRTVKLGLAASW